MPPAAFKGWKVFTVGDDIAWLRVGADGGLWAINPEAGYFGVAPGTSMKSNPNAMRSVEHDAIVHQCRDDRRRRYLVGGHGRARAGRTDRLARQAVGSRPRARRRRIRIAASRRRWGITRCLSPHADDAQGVPISAIIFGGRRATTMPLVLESSRLDAWRIHGRDDGLGDDGGGGGQGRRGAARSDGDAAVLRLQHRRLPGTLARDGRKRITKPPRIFMVNWFRKDGAGNSFGLATAKICVC